MLLSGIQEKQTAFKPWLVLNCICRCRKGIITIYLHPKSNLEIFKIRIPCHKYWSKGFLLS